MHTGSKGVPATMYPALYIKQKAMILFPCKMEVIKKTRHL